MVSRAPFAHGPLQHFKISIHLCRVANESVEREPVGNRPREGAQVSTGDGPGGACIERRWAFVREQYVEHARIADFGCVVESGVVEGPVAFQGWEDAANP